MNYRKMPLLVTGTLQNKKEKPFYPQQIYYSKGFLRRKGEIYNLDIFSEVKAHLPQDRWQKVTDCMFVEMALPVVRSMMTDIRA